MMHRISENGLFLDSYFDKSEKSTVRNKYKWAVDKIMKKLFSTCEKNPKALLNRKVLYEIDENCYCFGTVLSVNGYWLCVGDENAKNSIPLCDIRGICNLGQTHKKEKREANVLANKLRWEENFHNFYTVPRSSE